MKKINVFFLALIFAGCSTIGVKVSDVENKEFKISHLEIKNQIFKSNSNAKIGFDKKDKRMFGIAGCNSFFGSYEIKGNKIILNENIGATKMMCAPEEMKFEFIFLQNLQGEFDIIKDSDNNTILDNGKMKVYLE